MRRRTLRLAAQGSAGVALLLGIVILLGLLPRSVGVSWSDVAALEQHVRPGWLLALTVIWLFGLVAHTPVLTASLPGLTTRRALALNLAGSAIGNSVPLGGAVSVGLTSAMARSWGFSRVRVAAFLVVSALWNVLFRLVAGVLGLLWLALTHSSAGWRTGSLIASVSGGLLTMIALLLASERVCGRCGALVGTLAARLPRPGRGGVHPDRPTSAAVSFALSLLRVRRQMLSIVARGWVRMSVAMVIYLLLLALLLGGSLHAVGSPAGAGLVIAAVAIERLLTSIPITPGGAGVAELGLTACLTLSGVDPVLAVTATLIYRTFTFLLEIPVGLMVASGWAAGRRRALRLARFAA